MINIPLNLIFMALLVISLAGLIVLQVYLSKRASRWPGLLLPILSFCYPLIFITVVISIRGSFPVLPELLAFSLYSIPALVLLAIYAVCRKLYSKKSALEKMRLQDLE